MKRLIAMIKSLFAQSGDMMDVPQVDWSDPCGDCSTDGQIVYHAVETQHIR
jgi:hypothetical protein